MARTRYIKPGFFLDEELAELGPMHQVLYAGLWVIADREGRVEDRPKRIKAQVLPHYEADVDALLNDLQGIQKILRYVAADIGVVWVIAFEAHQKPHKNEPLSKLPEPYGLLPEPDGTCPDSSANPHGNQGSSKNAINPDLSSLARVSRSSSGSSQGSSSSQSSAREILSTLERIWPSRRCRDTDRPSRENAAFDALAEVDAETLTTAAKSWIAVNGFSDSNIDGCHALHNWLFEQGWLWPLPTSANPMDKTDAFIAQMVREAKEAA